MDGGNGGNSIGSVGTGRVGDGDWTRERLTELIHRILRDDLLAAGADFTPRSNLVESGLDSLAVTQLMLAVEEATGVWTDESLLTPENLETAETLAACIHEYASRGSDASPTHRG
jgi:acyl carrier protein